MHFGCGMSIFSLIKGDFGGLLVSANVLVESTVRIMTLLLDRRSEFHQLFWHGLVRLLEDVDESTCQSFLILGEKGDCTAVLTSTTSSVSRQY